MDHFENIIRTLLEAEGYWVRRSFKVKPGHGREAPDQQALDPPPGDRSVGTALRAQRESGIRGQLHPPLAH